jgi:hypothetical protein
VVDAWQQLQQALNDEQTTYRLQQHRRPTIRRMIEKIANLLHRIGYLLRLYEHAELRHEPATCRLKRLSQENKPCEHIKNSQSQLQQINHKINQLLSNMISPKQTPVTVPVCQSSTTRSTQPSQTSTDNQQHSTVSSSAISRLHFLSMPGDDSSDIKQRPSFYSTTFMN